MFYWWSSTNEIIIHHNLKKNISFLQHTLCTHYGQIATRRDTYHEAGSAAHPLKPVSKKKKKVTNNNKTEPAAE